MIAALIILAAALTVPDATRTPGAVRELSRAAVCGTVWGRDVRHVTVAMKRRVAAAYGVPWASRHLYEFDHLVPRELGGADDVRNLWPQPRDGRWNAHQKDVLENRLHRLVCAGTLSLVTAQTAIRTDWVAAYRRYLR